MHLHHHSNFPKLWSYSLCIFGPAVRHTASVTFSWHNMHLSSELSKLAAGVAAAAAAAVSSRRRHCCAFPLILLRHKEDEEVLAAWEKCTQQSVIVESERRRRLLSECSRIHKGVKGLRLRVMYDFEWKYIQTAIFSRRSMTARKDPSWWFECLKWFTRTASENCANNVKHPQMRL